MNTPRWKDAEFGSTNVTTQMYGVRLDLVRGHPFFKEAKKMAPEILRRISVLRKCIEQAAMFMEHFEEEHHLKMESRIFLADEKKVQDRIEFLTKKKGMPWNEARKLAEDPLEWWTITVSFTDVRGESNRLGTQGRSVILWLHYFEDDTPVGEAFFRFQRFVT